MTARVNLLIKYRDANVANLYSSHRPNLAGDAGFDLFFPEDVTFQPRETKFVPLGVFTAMTYDDAESKARILHVDRTFFYIWLAIALICLLISPYYIACAGLLVLAEMGISFWFSMLHGDYPPGLAESELVSDKFISYRIYPRSSISKTPLRLANSVGVVDSGYRGEIIAALDNISDSEYTVVRGARLVQLTSDIGNITTVRNVESFDETERGARGFGSTN